MSENLNERLFSRFGLEYPIERIRKGFRSEIRKVLRNTIDEVLHPQQQKDEDKWWDVQSEILELVCRNLFLDSDRYSGSTYDSGLNTWIREELSDSISFEEFLVRLQVLLDAIYAQSIYKKEHAVIINSMLNYVADFPVLGLTIKKYKKRASQIFPANTKEFDKKVKNTLDLLEVRDEYSQILEHYEQGLRELLSSKSRTQLKDSVEDMYTACDLAVASRFNDKKLGLRHMFLNNNARAIALGLNQWQIKIFNELRDWMDKIKHGAYNDYSFSQVEMIVLLTSELIRALLNSKKD